VEHAAVAKQIDAPQNLALIQTCTAPLVPLALHVSDLRTMPTLTRSVDAVHSLLMEPFTSCLGCASITLRLEVATHPSTEQECTQCSSLHWCMSVVMAGRNDEHMLLVCLCLCTCGRLASL
jgi:hypothetical protein